MKTCKTDTFHDFVRNFFSFFVNIAIFRLIFKKNAFCRFLEMFTSKFAVFEIA